MRTDKKRFPARLRSRETAPAKRHLIDSDRLPHAGIIPPGITDDDQEDHGYGWDLYTRLEEETE